MMTLAKNTLKEESSELILSVLAVATTTQIISVFCKFGELAYGVTHEIEIANLFCEIYILDEFK